MKSMDEKIMIQVRETGKDWEPSVECPAGDCHHNDDDDDDDADDNADENEVFIAAPNHGKAGTGTDGSWWVW